MKRVGGILRCLDPIIIPSALPFEHENTRPYTEKQVFPHLILVSYSLFLIVISESRYPPGPSIVQRFSLSKDFLFMRISINLISLLPLLYLLY